ncbi:hypothetical protein F5879DRAFT_989856 [Lentinula edodes]|nr:hypothetical protein F5879DRAFT_989856 [Lentinula edodes]
MDPVQNQVHEDGQQWHDASNSAPPPDIPKVHSAPHSESAQTVISGAFFAGAHRFSINGGSFNHSNGDINQDIVNDHSNRSNFGNRYGDNRSNSNNRTNNYNAGYNDNRIHGSSHWTQATARTQYRYDQTPAPGSGLGRGGRSSVPPNFQPSQRSIPTIPGSAYFGENPLHRPSSAPTHGAPTHVDARIIEGDEHGPYDSREEEPEYYYDPQQGPDTQYYQDYHPERNNYSGPGEEMYHEGQQQNQPRERSYYYSELQPVQPASTQPRFKSNNPFAKMMSP